MYGPDFPITLNASQFLDEHYVFKTIVTTVDFDLSIPREVKLSLDIADGLVPGLPVDNKICVYSTFM